MNKNLFGKSLDELAINRLKEFEEAALKKHPNGYWLAYSGGKDSDVILHLAKRSGVKFETHHNLTTIDPPELVKHVKTHPEVIIDKPPMSMARLIRKKGMPPRRNARYCCEILKEHGGAGRIVITGIRWGESNRRSKRTMTEACYKDATKHYLHPIIDWSTNDVWSYIRANEIDYCCLYNEGFKRLGCILCPMTRDVKRQIEKWPAIAAMWERNIKATFRESGGRYRFSDPEEYWQWWLNRDASALNSAPVLFEDDPSLIESGE